MLHRAVRSFAWAVLVVSLPLAAGARDRELVIAELEAAGQLNAEEALVYRLWSVRDPSRLPAELTALPAARTPCATELFARAFAARRDGRLSPWAAEQVKQASDRPASAGYVDSGTYALRVHYTDASQSNRARDVLGYAETSWRKQVTEVGFRAPLGDDGGSAFGGSRALDIYIGDAQGAAGFTAPEYDWPSTARADCTTWVMISDELSYSGEWMSTVAHEFNHVLQGAHDCTEWTAFWENSATYMQDVTYDSLDDYIWFLPDFQLNPHLPFEYHSYGSSAYQYGGMIVAMILDEAYGDGDGKTLRRVWETSEQNSYNSYEPDYLDAIDALVREQGGDGLDEFQRTLTVWRYLTGSRDDGSHLEEAGTWDTYCDDSCEPPDDRVHPFSTLPVNGTVREPLYVHGSSYIRVPMEQRRTGMLRVDFGGDPTTRWAATVLCRGDGPVSETSLAVNAGGSASGQVQVMNSDSCTLAVTHLYLTTYDPDEDFDRATNRTYTYNYAFSFTAGALPAPEITAIQPSELTCAGGTLVISGKNFFSGAVVQIGTDLAPVSQLTATSISVQVPSRAASGVVPVTVVNPDNQRVTWSNAVVFTGAGCYCGCDVSYGCDEGCECDVECVACLCDHTLACDPECDCDPQCEGCGCGAAEPAVGLLLLALVALRARPGRCRRSRPAPPPAAGG